MEYGGYVGKILRVDLSNGGITELNTEDYVPDYIGGIGIGYKIVWDETNENTTEWSPESPIIFASGPLCGTPAPSTARAEVIGLAPQSYPEPWAAPSGFGGDFGPKLKFAGYDAVVIVGKASAPKYLYISEDSVEIKDGEFLWGMTTYTTQSALTAKHGVDTSIACIGPAGENLCRWAAILSKTENGAGQGGFGAVMGDKKIKAIVVKPGTHKIPIADPDKLLEEVVKVSAEMSPTGQNSVPLVGDADRFTTRRQSCAWSGCTGGVAGCLPTVSNNVPLKYIGDGSISGIKYCVGGCAPWLTDNDWGNAERNFELNKLCDMLGVNCWEAFAGMNWFLQNCYNAGKLTTLMGESANLNPDGPNVYPKTAPHAGMSNELAVKWIRGVPTGRVKVMSGPRVLQEQQK